MQLIRPIEWEATVENNSNIEVKVSETESSRDEHLGHVIWKSDDGDRKSVV